MPDLKDSPSRQPGQRAPRAPTSQPPNQTHTSNTAHIESSTTSQPKPKTSFQNNNDAARRLKFRPALYAVGWFTIIVSGVWLGAAWKGEQTQVVMEKQEHQEQQQAEAARQSSKDETLAVLVQRRAGLVRAKQDLEEKLARLEQRKKP